MNLPLLYEDILTRFFLLSVSLANLIRGGIWSTWGHNFYTGMQSGSKLDLLDGLLIHTFELET